MKIQNVTDFDFHEKVLKNDRPVLVGFWAIWCIQSKIGRAVIGRLLEGEFQDIRYVKIDVESNIKIPQKYKVIAIPTFVMFYNGLIIDRYLGGGYESNFRYFIENALTLIEVYKLIENRNIKLEI